MDHQLIQPLRVWLAEKRGRQVALAAVIRVRPSVVGAWVSQRRPIPVEHAARIEEFTEGAVTRQDLRPDDWRDIWPELADSEPNRPAALIHQARAATETVANGAVHA